MKNGLYTLALILPFICYSCENEHLDGGPVPYSINIFITDLEGNDLLDKSYPDNIVSGKPIMTQNKTTFPIRIGNFQGEDFQEYDSIMGGKHFFYLTHWHNTTYKNEITILDWGKGIKKDTICYSAGHQTFTNKFKITFNGKEGERIELPQEDYPAVVFKKAMP